jgi:hypothetical protein
MSHAGPDGTPPAIPTRARTLLSPMNLRRKKRRPKTKRRVVKFFVTVGRREDFTKEKTPVNLTLDGNIETDSTESADCRRFQARTD